MCRGLRAFFFCEHCRKRPKNSCTDCHGLPDSAKNRGYTVKSSLFILTCLSLSVAVSLADSTADTVKDLGQRYTQVEAQLDRSAHYLKTENSGGVTTTQQAWFNAASDPIKVATERKDASGSELTEYVALDFNNIYSGVFVLTRKETPQPDGGTQVDESRRYFFGNSNAQDLLIRELRKSAHFKAGESLDTVHVANVPVNLAALPKDESSVRERADAAMKFLSSVEDILIALRKAGPPVTDPFAGAKGDSARFRIIHGTVSPDGRYAIALGLTEKDIGWETLAEQDQYGYFGPTYYAEGANDICNYVVEVASQRILGKTGCAYFGTRRRYNHRECEVTWSPDSTFFVQLWDDKWASESCWAGRIAPGSKLVGVVDLAKKAGAADKAVAINSVTNDGLVDLDVVKNISSGERKGDVESSFNKRIRLRTTPAGLGAEVVSSRKTKQ